MNASGWIIEGNMPKENVQVEVAQAVPQDKIEPAAVPEFDRASQAAAAYLSPRQIFSEAGLSELNQRSNWKGSIQLLGHLGIMGLSGYLWLTHVAAFWIGIPSLIIYGFSFASMFAAMHECVHRTAFANNRTNDLVGWVAGLLSFYNGTFYRRYHKWHHRYTRIPGKDPELTDLTPTTLWEYLWVISGIPWWIGKLQTHWRCATAQMDEFPYIPDAARAEVQRSVLLQLAVYGVAIALSIYFQSLWFVLGWVLPLAVGQPILRLILLAEHTGCSLDANPFANTRTTLTWAPLRFLMWNMPFHAEHHFCPSLPFHALGKAHQYIRSQLQHVDPGYLAVNANLIQKLGQL
jgi:fatty acid desaturase